MFRLGEGSKQPQQENKIPTAFSTNHLAILTWKQSVFGADAKTLWKKSAVSISLKVAACRRETQWSYTTGQAACSRLPQATGWLSPERHPYGPLRSAIHCGFTHREKSLVVSATLFLTRLAVLPFFQRVLLHLLTCLISDTMFRLLASHLTVALIVEFILSFPALLPPPQTSNALLHCVEPKVFLANSGWHENARSR